MVTYDPAQIARLAEGLSEAMKAALTKGVWQPGWSTYSVWISVRPATARALWQRGLQIDHLLTPLGLAVRAHLTAAQEKK